MRRRRHNDDPDPGPANEESTRLTPPAEGAARPRAILAALMLAAMAYSQLQAMVGPALPTLQREFGADTSDLAWIMNGFILSAAVATPVAGRLGDMFGRRRVLLVALVLLAVGTAMCGIAQTLPMMIVGRVVAGLGGAVFPLSFAIVRECLPRARVGPAIGLLSALVGVGGGVGIVAAGPIISHLSYHWLFWLPLVLIAAALAATVAWVPGDASRVPGRVDWVGALLLSGALVGLLSALARAGTWGWTSSAVLALFVGSGVLLAAWVWQAGRTTDPLIDLRTMRLRAVWAANATAVLCGITMSTSMFLLPQMGAQPRDTGFGLGMDITRAGLLILPQSFTILLAGVVGGRACARYGTRAVLMSGALAGGSGLVVIAFLHHEPWQAFLGSAVVGLGTGFVQTALGTLVVDAVPAEQTAAAAGANTVARNIGMTLGAQQAATILGAGG
ncbi:MFS transporter, partial [Streptomyces sp. SID3343]|uniref:MFS transporter n=1 Tax=Streptomyces sp. SID3343 TaxID=2690260 RepID=UPI00136BAB22|nr:MFS transporter [Streptomyces sp. SID3343]